MIKLLPKSDLAKEKAKQTSREIQEGVKIATRVDGLRSLWAKTEQDFEKYKIATLGAIQKDIDSLNGKKDNLSVELHEMQSKYDSLMPDIVSKRLELAQFEKSLTSWEKKLDKREEGLNIFEKEVNDSFKKVEDSRIRTEDNERISQNLLHAADEKNKQAQIALSTANNIQDEARISKTEIEKLLNDRENIINEKEKELAEEDLLLMNERKDLDKDKIKVNDMRQTLERSIQRIKEGKRA
jgi:chromosome segregation ATPase